MTRWFQFEMNGDHGIVSRDVLFISVRGCIAELVRFCEVFFGLGSVSEYKDLGDSEKVPAYSLPQERILRQHST